MSTDWYTRLMLTVIAGSLALLVVQGFHEGTGAGAPGPEEEGRFRVTFVPMARMMFRVDSATGKTWRAIFPDVKIWTPVADSPAELLDEAVGEPPGSPAPEAAAPAAPEAPGDAVTP